MTSLISSKDIASTISRQHGHILRDARKLIDQLLNQGINLTGCYEIVPQGSKRTAEIKLSYELSKALLNSFRNVDVGVLDALVVPPTTLTSSISQTDLVSHILKFNNWIGQQMCIVKNLFR
jgi:hypothetical protein